MEIPDDSFFTNDTAWPPFHHAAKSVYYLLGTFLAIVGVTGIVGNALVIVVFTRFKRLKGPFSILILNLALGDLLTSILHIMVVVSSFKGKWAFSRTGCVFYAFGVGFSGTMSIFTLAAISVERYLVIIARPMSRWKMTAAAAKRLCVSSWLYCSCLTLPPVFGWSKYTVEGVLTSCSWDYMTRSWDNTLFYLYLLGFGFFFPMSVILYCYTFIISAVLAHAREMSSVNMTLGGVLSRYRVNVDARTSAFKTSETILMLIIFFFLSWTPYAIVTMIGHFGPEGVLTPYVCAFPAFCAKASVVCNPIIYGWTHPHFKTSVKLFFSTWRTDLPTVECSNRVNTQRSHSTQSNHELHFRCYTTKQINNANHQEPDTLPNRITCSTECFDRPASANETRHTMTSIHLKRVRECSV
ncbi:7 transmembrane receptor (rhodopsin family) [Nesidiocoris tenuis]|uniref:7 transmembrane receptor (Rhodopsin family) n=1 Tax=Nesidiocoris tenuis TaxID=355587 RepID=A0ABN7A8H4_9HEMI|nr:7 transmembrane receptor (rhodopsin family) [Nesidiocoris tenuis]